MQAQLGSHHPFELRLQATRALGRIHGDVARQKVVEMQEHPDKVLRGVAGKAYNGEYLLQVDVPHIFFSNHYIYWFDLKET